MKEPQLDLFGAKPAPGPSPTHVRPLPPPPPPVRTGTPVTVLLPPPSRKESATSVAAARAIESQAPIQRDRVLALLRKAGPLGMTDTEISTQLRMQLQTVVPRRGELVKLGFVQNSGTTRQTPARRASTVWVAI